MAIELQAQESGSPIPLDAGVYAAKVSGVEEADGGQFGDQVKLLLTTDEPDADGQPIELWAWASRKLTTRSKLWRWVTALTGSPPQLGRVFTIEDLLIGKPCRVQITEETLDDGTVRKKVSDILASSTRPANPAEAVDGTCDDCGATVDYYTQSGAPYCDAHGPQAKAPA